MKTILLVVLSAALNACSGAVYYQCSSPYFNEVWSEGNINCGQFNQNAKTALDMLAKAGFVSPGEQHLYHRVHVTVELDKWNLDDNENVSGTYTLNEIHISSSGMSLLHEMLHHWQTMNWILDTGEHPHWDTNGYYALDNAFATATDDKPLFYPDPQTSPVQVVPVRN